MKNILSIKQSGIIVILFTFFSLTSSAQLVQTNEENVFTIVEEMPMFPGGDREMMKFLQTNIAYPDSAHDAGIQGAVYISFIVEKDGKLTNTKVIKSSKNKFLDEEALRVVKLMPTWIPGKQNGKVVRVMFNLPIKFTLK